MTQETNVLPVEQSDREALIALRGWSEREAHLIENTNSGKYDAESGLQFLARHRLNERERCARIAEMHGHRGDIANAIRETPNAE